MTIEDMWHTAMPIFIIVWLHIRGVRAPTLVGRCPFAGVSTYLGSYPDAKAQVFRPERPGMTNR